ncbi:MAG: PE-PPE domain-containing protein [Rhodococcus sp. (in: high G+C Gram-positive bacteria)]
MRTTIRRAGVACGTLIASAAVAVSTATGAGASSSALVIGGLSTPSLHDLIMAQLLGGDLQGQERVSVNWPAEAGPYTGSGDLTLGQSINVGITNLDTQIAAALGRLSAAGEQVTVVGLSAGSLVVNEVLRLMAADPDAPDASQIKFIVVADSSRQELIKDSKYNPRYDYTYQPAPETAYDISVVTGEYDGMADFPDRWWNFTAVLNAIAGGIFVHIPVMFADLDSVPAENITVDVNSLDGTTTHYLVPTAKLPLVRLLPFLASQEAELKAKIDKAYIRNDAPTTALRTLAAPAVTEEVEEVTAVEEAAESSAPASDVSRKSAVVETAVEPVEAVVDEVSVKEDAAVEVDAVEDDDSDAEAAEADAAEAEAAAAEAEAAAAEADAAEAEAAEAAEAADAADEDQEVKRSESDDSAAEDSGSTDSDSTE